MKQPAPTAQAAVIPRQGKQALYKSNKFCAPLDAMYTQLTAGKATTWNQVEANFLQTMSAFDSGIPSVPGQFVVPSDTTALSAALQNGKGDWFNDVLAYLLEQCSGIPTLYVRRHVPGLIVPSNNLDGVYPGDPTREIEFLLEAKMLGTPKHANSPKAEAGGRPGSADIGKRVKELAFKSIDLKGEAARRMAVAGGGPTGGAGGVDLSTWLHGSRPTIYFFMAVRVLSDTDFKATVRWAETAAQVVDAVGLYCYEPTAGSMTQYQVRAGVPTPYQLDKVLWRACQALKSIKTVPPQIIPPDLPPSPAVEAEQAARQVSGKDDSAT